MNDVIVIGGGSTGLSIADKLSARRYSVTVVDETPIARYSSTRNQGWLQSGAYYACVGQEAAAVACKEGSAAIVRDCSEAVRSDLDSHLLFERPEDLERAIELCGKVGITALPLDSLQMRALIDRNPMLRGSRLKFAVATDDRPIDTSVLLRRIADRAAAQGTQFRSISHMHLVAIDRTDDGWSVSLGQGQSISARVIVAAAGPYQPQLLASCHPDLAKQLQPTKIPVCAMSSSAGALVDTMLIAPYAVGSPNTVPFRGVAGEGITICIADADRDCDQRGASDEDPPRNVPARFEKELSFWYPALKGSLADRVSLEAHFYMCQKLKRVSSTPTRKRMLDVLNEDDGKRRLLSVYPGKLTATPMVAKECADMIEQENWIQPSPAGLRPGTPPTVAVQPYFDPATYRYTSSGVFESL